MKYSKEAQSAVLLYRLGTVAALALSAILFMAGSSNTTTRVIVFVAWMAICLFGCILIISDLVSRQHIKAQRFESTIALFEKNSGGDRQAGVKSLYLSVILGVVLKLAVPVVLFFIFR